jgi:tetratricopeptide (TPR) repeat protein
MTSPSPVLLRARALLMADRPREALTELAGLPADEALGPAAAHLRGAALAALEQWPAAADAARAGLAAGGPDPALLGLLGRALQEMGELPAAERALLDGLALAPDDADLLCGYARLCLAANQVDKADQLAQRAAQLAPQAPAVYAARVQVAYAKGDDRAAQRISREFLAEHPENPSAHALHGSTSAVRGQVGPAYTGLRDAAAARPTEQVWAESAMEMRVARHPLMLPVRPILRYGPLKTWLVAILLIFGLRSVGLPFLSFIVAMAWLAFCVYSWVVPPLLRRWMLRSWR